jgi:hypothetical protein
MSFFNPKSWGRPFTDLYNKGKDAIVDVAQGVAADVVDVAELIGDGVTDVGGMIGDGVVTMGESVGSWSVTAAGDVVDWSKTSFSEVREWTEGAAGDFAGFTVDLYDDARGELESAGKFLYEQLANFFTETLPKLGPIDPQVRAVAASLLTDEVASGLERAAKASYCTITVGLRAQALGSATAGIYVCGDGWGLFHGATLSVIQGAVKLLQDGATISGSAAMIFGPRERASGTKAFKLGLSLSGKAPGKPSLGIGGVVLMEATAPPLFLGFRYEVSLSFGLGGKKKPDADGKVKWKVNATKPTPNGEFYEAGATYAELALEDVCAGLDGLAPNWDAAVRAWNDPQDADRIAATAASAALSPFAPRYYGGIRAAYGQPKEPRERSVIGNAAGVVGVVGVAGDQRATFCVVAGLADPQHVSIEAVGDPTLYWWIDPNGNIKLVPLTKDLDRQRATFRMVRGLRGRGVALVVASDPPKDPRFVICSHVQGDMVMPSASLFAARWSDQKGVDRFKDESTFLLDRPVDPPAAEGSLLREGDALRAGQWRRAPNGLFSLYLAPNGRLVVRQRGDGAPNGPNAWLVYQPGLIQDAVLLWAWASPAVGPEDGNYYARVHDGRLEVRRGSPAADAGLHWQSEVHGAPGRCFAAISNQGVVTVLRGEPADPGEIVWTSPTGPLHWPLRRSVLAVQAPDSTYWVAIAGGGKADPEALIPPPAQELRAGSPHLGGWEHFELEELWSGKVAIRAQARRFVGVADGGTRLEVKAAHVGPRQLFTLEVTSTPGTRLRLARLRADANGRYVGVSGATLVADRDQAGAALFRLHELDFDLTAHAGRAFYLIARHSGLAVEPRSGDPGQGTHLVQRRLGGHEHQKWWVRYHGGPDFNLVNRATDQSIDISGGAAGNGGVALQWPWHGGNNQRIALRPAGDGAYHLVMKHSGRALDVEGGKTTSGAPVLQWDLHGGNNQRFELRLADGGPSSIWRALGGGLTSAPVITSWGPGRLDVFARGADQAVWQMWSDGQWRSWTSMGGQIPGDVSAIAPTPNRLDIFVRGMDNAVWQRWWDGSKWNGFVSLGGAITSAVCALSPFPNRWDLFARGADGALWQRTAHGGWSPWTKLDGLITTTPAALYVDGRFYVFVRGTDGALWLCSYTNAWTWQRLDGIFKGEPAVTSAGPGSIDVFVIGTDDAIWNCTLRDGAWHWSSVGGKATSDPAAISCAPGQVDVFVRGADNTLTGRRRKNGVWQPWRDYGGELQSKPALASSAPGQIDVAALSADNSLWVGTIR